MPEQSAVCVPFPYVGTPITQSILENLRIRGFFSGVQPFANLAVHGLATGLPNAAAKPKYFKSLSPYGIFITGRLKMDGVYAQAFSSPSFNIYSPTFATFLRDRVVARDPEFAEIPAVDFALYPDYDKLNMTPDYGKDPAVLNAGRVVTAEEQAWPLGTLHSDPVGNIELYGSKYRASFPSNHGIKFDSAGRPVVFSIEEYNAAFPIKTKVYVGDVPTTAGTIKLASGTDEAFKDAVVGLLISGVPAAKFREEVQKKFVIS